MAQQVTVQLTDDLDPSLTATETVEFGVDGVAYAIDLHPKNSKKLRDLLAPWITSARKVGRAPKKTVTVKKPHSDRAAIRAWAQSVGMVVGDRGRIPADIICAYNDRGSSTHADAKKARVQTALSDAVEQ